MHRDSSHSKVDIQSPRHALSDTEIAKRIDHTWLKALEDPLELEKWATEAKKHGYHSVCTFPPHTRYLNSLLKGSSVKVCSVIGFPTGLHELPVKLREVELAIEAGATEIDVVWRLDLAKQNEWKKLHQELSALRSLAAGNSLKIIIESLTLSNKQKQIACDLMAENEIDFLKTSTGFFKNPTTVEDVAELKKNLHPSVKLKASGGIRSKKHLIDLIQAGADRLGLSRSVEVMAEDVTNE